MSTAVAAPRCCEDRVKPNEPLDTADGAPVDVPWYGDGRLQLRNVAVELPAVTELVSVGGGAAYVDDDGDLAFAGPTGHVTPLGRTPLGSPVVASDDGAAPAAVKVEPSSGKLR